MAAPSSTSAHLLLFRAVWLCSTLSVALPARPPNVTIGALFTFDSVIGRSAMTAIRLAVDDVNRDATVLRGTNLTVLMQDTRCSGFVGAIQALELMEKRVVAVVGPQSSEIAHVVSHVVNELRVPLVTFAATDPALRYPFLARAARDDSPQMRAVADVVARFGWREVTAVHVDDAYGRGGVDALGDALRDADARARVSYRAAFPPGARRAALRDVLLRAGRMESRVFVVHVSPDSGLDVFAAAQSLGMMSAGYVWIATDWLAAVIDESASRSPASSKTTSLVQGVVTFRPYTPESDAKRSLLSRSNNGSSRSLNAYGLFAYDAVWMAARAIDAFLEDDAGGGISFSADPNIRDASGSALRLSSLRVFDQGEQLLRRLLQANFTGVTGRVQLGADGGALADPAYEVLNVIGTGVRRVGYWSNRTRLTVNLSSSSDNGQKQNQQLHSIIWPGETASAPRGWVFPDSGKPLRIGVPYRTTYRELVSRDPTSPDGVSGYCIDVFKAALALLPYPVPPPSFVPFGDGVRNPSYGELVRRVADGALDAAVGDISIVRNRTRAVDFTLPYAESGLVIVTAVRVVRGGGGASEWAFLRPFTPVMWALTGAFLLFVGAVVWVLERRHNPDFGGSPRTQVVTVFWFSLSTVFVTPRENTVSALGRAVLLVWLFVLLIVKSSYTASLTSLLTAQHLAAGVQGLDGLLASRDHIGYQEGSFARGYLTEELGVPAWRLRELAAGEYADSLRRGPAGGGVAAIVDEMPYVQLFLADNCEFRTVGPEFTNGGWGFAFPRGSPLAVDLSTAILALSENGDLERIHDKWLSQGTCASSSSSSSTQSGGMGGDVAEEERLDLSGFWGLLLVCGVACFVALVVYFVRILCQYLEYHRHAHEEGSSSLHDAAAGDDDVGGSSRRRPARLKCIRRIISFVDMKEAEVERVIRSSRSGERSRDR